MKVLTQSEIQSVNGAGDRDDIAFGIMLLGVVAAAPVALAVLVVGGIVVTTTAVISYQVGSHVNRC